MGLIAHSVLELGGRANGVIPAALVELKVAHEGITELYRVETMHERKAKMTELADAFLALPGGIGCWTNCSKRGAGMRSAITPSPSACSMSKAFGTG